MIYLIYGEQNIRIKTRIKKILKDVLPEQDEFNFVKFDGSEVLMQDWLDEVNYLPLGYDNKVVVVENCYFLLKPKPRNKIDSEQDYEQLKRYLNDANDFCDLILTVAATDKEIDKKGEIYSLIQQNNGNIFAIVNPSPEEWKSYTYRLCKEKLNVNIDQNALSELTVRTACDVDLLLNCLDKLSLYTDHITYDDVVLMVPRPLEENTFLIFNHLISGKNELAIGVFRDLKVNNVEPITLVSMLSKQFRLLNQVYYLVKCGANDQDIVNELNIKSTRVPILKRNLVYVSEKSLHRTLDDLFKLDMQIKSGQVDRYYAFELFLINYKRK